MTFRDAYTGQGSPDAAHVEMGNFHNLGEAIDPGSMCGVQLFLSDGAQGPHKLHNGLTVQLVTTNIQHVRSSGCNGTQ